MVGVLQFVFGMKLPVCASDALIEALFCPQNSSKMNSWQSKHIQSYSKGSVLPKKESPTTDCSVVYLSRLFCSSCFRKTRWSIKKCQVNFRFTPVSWPPAIGELCVMWHVLSVDPEWGEPWMSSVFIYKNRQCNISCVPNHLLPFLSLLRLWSVRRSTTPHCGMFWAAWIVQCIVTHALHMRMHSKYWVFHMWFGTHQSSLQS